MSKPQLHVSQMDTLSRCGIQFQRRYGALFDVWHEEEIQPPSIALVQGTTVHRVVEKNLRNKMETGELLHHAAITDFASSCWDEETAKEIFLSPDEKAVGESKVRGVAKDVTLRLSLLHHFEAAPLIIPIGIEEKWVLNLVPTESHPHEWPFDLAGTIDIREENAIADTKTRSASPPANAVHSIQLGMYTISEQQIHKRTPEKIRLDCLVKTKTPKYVRVEGKPTEKLLAATHARIERAAELIESVQAGKQAFTPADPEHWCCTTRFCGYARTCPFWSGRQ